MERNCEFFFVVQNKKNKNLENNINTLILIKGVKKLL